MSDVQWDRDEMEKEIIALFMRQIAVKSDVKEAPMHEIRARFELAGVMIGRTLAMVNHEGPINAEIALKVRWFEEHYKERCLRTAGNLLGPGGTFREDSTSAPRET
ncbi:hypothetical protein [Pseudomonas putida]|uniref:hypothetical protein n=1 Tax=Pseudomonas putida TaxID=303 RepID=UPI001E4DA1A3|nr:hypothetical protein [Pseudomonas putida]MCE0975129.1 hypothetical protein [Pseudomonas putida]